MKLGKKLLPKYFAVISWMLLIFLFSSEPASESSVRSSGVVRFLRTYDSSDASSISTFLVRKAAHMFLYLILAMLVYALVRTYQHRGRMAVGLTLAVCFLYACSDEIHQLFSKGRSAEFRDVVVDVVGSSIGLVLYTLVLACSNRWLARKKVASERA